MLEWYEAYADYRDTMDRIEELVETVAREVLGTTTVSVPGPRARPERAVGARSGFTDALEAKELWTRDEAELRARLTERGVDTTPTRTGRSSSTTPSATSSSRS